MSNLSSQCALRYIHSILSPGPAMLMELMAPVGPLLQIVTINMPASVGAYGKSSVYYSVS